MLILIYFLGSCCIGYYSVIQLDLGYKLNVSKILIFSINLTAKIFPLHNPKLPIIDLPLEYRLHTKSNVNISPLLS